MNKLHSTVVLALACQFLMTSIVSAQAGPANPANPADPMKLWSVRAGLGFTASPGSFLLNIEADRLMRDEVAVGLALQLGVHDNRTLVSPILFARYIFDLSSHADETVRKIKPYAQGGLGFTHYDKDKGSGSKDDTNFLMSLGVGLDYPLNETIDIGSRMLINVIPAEVLDTRLFFSWEIISIRYRW